MPRQTACVHRYVSHDTLGEVLPKLLLKQDKESREGRCHKRSQLDTSSPERFEHHFQGQAGPLEHVTSSNVTGYKYVQGAASSNAVQSIEADLLATIWQNGALDDIHNDDRRDSIQARIHRTHSCGEYAGDDYAPNAWTALSGSVALIGMPPPSHAVPPLL